MKKILGLTIKKKVAILKSEMTRPKIDITKRIISLKKKGVAHAEIARSLGCSRSTVINTLKEFAAVFDELPNVKTYQEHKADLLSAAELKVLKSLVQGDKLAKATLNQSAYALQVLHNAGRLERGQATNITASYSKVITEDVSNSKVIDVTQDD